MLDYIPYSVTLSDPNRPPVQAKSRDMGMLVISRKFHNKALQLNASGKSMHYIAAHIAPKCSVQILHVE